MRGLFYAACGGGRWRGRGEARGDGGRRVSEQRTAGGGVTTKKRRFNGGRRVIGMVVIGRQAFWACVDYIRRRTHVNKGACDGRISARAEHGNGIFPHRNSRYANAAAAGGVPQGKPRLLLYHRAAKDQRARRVIMLPKQMCLLSEPYRKPNGGALFAASVVKKRRPAE